MRLTIAYSKIKKRNLVFINNDTYQRETLSERPIRQPLNEFQIVFSYIKCTIFGSRVLHNTVLVIKVPILSFFFFSFFFFDYNNDQATFIIC